MEGAAQKPQQNTQGKEAVLVRLLETQESYIQELEAKCKSMTDQLTESPMKPGASIASNELDSSTVNLLLFTMPQKGAPVHEQLASLQQHYESVGKELESRKMSSLVQVAKNWQSVVQSVRQENQIESECYIQKDTHQQQLIKQLQQKFSKERQEMQTSFEKTETQLQNKALKLEQEIAVLKMQLEAPSPLKAHESPSKQQQANVMQELEQLEQKYRQSDDELRAEGSALRKQITSLSKQNRELSTSLFQAKQQLDVCKFDQFTALKRLEESLKQIRAEVTHGFKVLETQNSHSNRLQIQGAVAAPYEMAEQMDDSYSAVTQGHGSLQRELELAHQEIEFLQSQSTEDLWQDKLDIVEKEKKLVADELQKIAKGFQLRESCFQRDLKHCQHHLQKLQVQKQAEQKAYQDQIGSLAAQLKSLIQSDSQNSTANMPVIQLVTPQDVELLHQENSLLKAQNSQLRQMCLSSDQQVDTKMTQVSQVQAVINKVTLMQNRVNQCIDRADQLSSEILSASSISPNDSNNQESNLQHKELTQAKKSLMMYIHKCNQLEELLDSELGDQPATMAQRKLEIDCEQLKAELAQAKQINQEPQSRQRVEPIIVKSTTFQELRSELTSFVQDLHTSTQNLAHLLQPATPRLMNPKPTASKKTSMHSSQSSQQPGPSRPVQTMEPSNDLLDLYNQQMAQKTAEMRRLQVQTTYLKQREAQLAHLFAQILADKAQWQQQIEKEQSVSDYEKCLKQCEAVKQESTTSLALAQDTTDGQSVKTLLQKVALLEEQLNLHKRELDQTKRKFNSKHLQTENDRLKKHIVQRQHEVNDQRNKHAQAQKQLRERHESLENDLARKYKDRLSQHIKVFDLELTKLQAVIRTQNQQ